MPHRQTLLNSLLFSLLAVQFYTSHLHAPTSGALSLASGTRPPAPTATVPAPPIRRETKKVSEWFESRKTMILPNGVPNGDETENYVVDGIEKIEKRSGSGPRFSDHTEAGVHLLVSPLDASCNCGQVAVDLTAFGVNSRDSTLDKDQVDQILKVLDAEAKKQVEKAKQDKERAAEETAKRKKQAEEEKQKAAETKEKYARCEVDKQGNPIDTAMERAECWGEQLTQVRKTKNKDGKTKSANEIKSDLNRIFGKFEKELRSLLRKQDHFEDARSLAEKIAARLTGDEEEKYANKLTAMVLGAELHQERAAIYERAQKDLMPLFNEAYQQEDVNLQSALYQEALRQHTALSQEYYALQNATQISELNKMVREGQLSSADYSQYTRSDFNTSFEQLMRGMMNPKTIYKGTTSSGPAADYSAYSADRLKAAGGAPIITNWSELHNNQNFAGSIFPASTYNRFGNPYGNSSLGTLSNFPGSTPGSTTNQFTSGQYMLNPGQNSRYQNQSGSPSTFYGTYPQVYQNPYPSGQNTNLGQGYTRPYRR